MRGEGAMQAIEIAYRLDLDTEDWLHAIAAIACDALGDPEMPKHAAIYRSDDQGHTHLARVCTPWDDEFLRTVDRMEAALPRSIRASKYRSTLCATSTELAKEHGYPGFIARAILGRMIGRWGYCDALQMQGAVIDDVSIGVTCGLREPFEIPSRMRQTWERVGVHLAAGLRLRRGLARPADALASAGLVLERGGSVAHASPEVAADNMLRDTLRECARSVDAARGALAKDAQEKAVNLWQGLFAGRWSVLEVFDTDGRAYVVAHENDPDVAETRALTRRERQVLELASRGHGDPLIAYTLGISVSTVQTHLSRGLAKAGFRSRAKLVRTAATLQRRLDRP